MIVRTTELADKLQSQTFSPEITHFNPCKYNPRNKNVPVPGYAHVAVNAVAAQLSYGCF